MTPTDDYRERMTAPARIDDVTAEALLRGEPVAAELEPVATVMRALREASDQPLSPSAELAAGMAAGRFPADPAAAGLPAAELAGPDRAWAADAALPVSTATHPPADRRSRRRVGAVRRAVIGQARGVRLAARLAAGGLAVAVAGAGAAGFAGTLPEPAQTGFQNVVESVLPYRFSELPAGPPGSEQNYHDSPGGVEPGSTVVPQPPGKPGQAPGGAPDGAPADPSGQEEAPGPVPHDNTPPGLIQEPGGPGTDSSGAGDNPQDSGGDPPTEPFQDPAPDAGDPAGSDGPGGEDGRGDGPGRDRAPGPPEDRGRPH